MDSDEASFIANGRHWWKADVGATRGQRYIVDMKASADEPPTSLGLWGDGDEIAAIEEVEQRFGVKLDCSDAASWVTAGDVFAALRRALPPDQTPAPEAWLKFADAISAETGVDATKVEPTTLLLGDRRLGWRGSLLVAVFAGLLFAMMLHW